MEFTKNEKEAIIDIIYEQLIGWVVETGNYDKERVKRQIVVAFNFFRNHLGVMSLEDVKTIVERDGGRVAPIEILFEMPQYKKEIVLKVLRDFVYIDDKTNVTQVNVLQFVENVFSGIRKI